MTHGLTNVDPPHSGMHVKLSLHYAALREKQVDGDFARPQAECHCFSPQLWHPVIWFLTHQAPTAMSMLRGGADPLWMP